MIRPPRGTWAFISRNAPRVIRNAPVRLVSTTARQVSRATVLDRRRPAPRRPALLNSRSSRPNRSPTIAKSASTAASSVMSAGTTIASAPAAAQRSRAVSSSGARRRPTSTTVKPAPASPTAAARPIPEPAPVMSAILSVSMRMQRATGAAAASRLGDRPERRPGEAEQARLLGLEVDHVELRGPGQDTRVVAAGGLERRLGPGRSPDHVAGEQVPAIGRPAVLGRSAAGSTIRRAVVSSARSMAGRTLRIRVGALMWVS